LVIAVDAVVILAKRGSPIKEYAAQLPVDFRCQSSQTRTLDKLARWQGDALEFRCSTLLASKLERTGLGADQADFDRGVSATARRKLNELVTAVAAEYLRNSRLFIEP